MQENKIKNYALLHFIVFIWGFTAILGALISIDAIPLVWYRMLLAAIFIFIYFIITKKSFRVDRKALLKFALIGCIIAMHWIAFFKAIKVSTVSIALVTMSTGALFTSLIEPIFYKRKIKSIELVLGLLVVIGLYIIFNFESQYTLGIIIALISALLASTFAVLNGLAVRTHDPNVISFYQLLFGAGFISVYLVFTGGFDAQFFELSNLDWFYMLILSSICTAFAFIVSVKVMKFLSPYTVMLTLNLEPVYAIVLALIIFGEKEQMKPGFYLGGTIVIFVVLLNGLLKNKDYIKKKFRGLK